MVKSIPVSVALSALAGPMVYFVAEATLQRKLVWDGRFSSEAADEWFWQSLVTFPAIYLVCVVLLCAALLLSVGVQRFTGRRIEECGFAVGVLVALALNWPNRLDWMELTLGGLFVLVPAVIYARLRPA